MPLLASDEQQRAPVVREPGMREGHGLLAATADRALYATAIESRFHVVEFRNVKVAKAEHFLIGRMMLLISNCTCM